MKFFLDQNISPRTTAFLRDLGHDVVDTRIRSLGGATDEEIWTLCVSEDRILVSFDLDFSDVGKYGPGMIIFRTRSTKSATINACLKNLFDHFQENELRGKLFIVTENRIRVRSK